MLKFPIFATILHFLRFSKSHKNFLASLLLVLYAFIATPVSYWHHHTSLSYNKNAGKTSFSVNVANASGDFDCEICSHHYLDAGNHAIAAFFTPPLFIKTVNSFYLLKKLPISVYRQFNKGPPSLI
jgi:hypothetical protein